MGSELWERLRVARAHAGISQVQVAKECGIERASVSQWEAREPEKRTTPGITRLRAYEKLTGAPLSWLMDDESDLTPDWKARVHETALEYATSPRDLASIEIPIVGIENGRPGASLLFRPGSLEKRGVKSAYAEIHQAPDDAMSPRIDKGDSILVDGKDTAVQDGRVYLVEWAGVELVRMLFRELDGSVRLVAANRAPEFRDRTARIGDEGFNIVGRVRWVAKWVD